MRLSEYIEKLKTKLEIYGDGDIFLTDDFAIRREPRIIRGMEEKNDKDEPESTYEII